MSFTVGFCREGKVASEALKWPLSIMCPQMTDQGALVSAGVVTEVTFVWRQTQVGANVA